MSMYDRAKKDTARILGNESGFSVPVVFTSPTGVSIPARWFFIDVNIDIDPSTGLPMIARKCAGTVSFYLSDGVTLQFPAQNPVDTSGIWKATFSNSLGQSVEYLVENQIADRTLCTMTMTLKNYTKRIIPAPVEP